MPVAALEGQAEPGLTEKDSGVLAVVAELLPAGACDRHRTAWPTLRRLVLAQVLGRAVVLVSDS